MPLQPSAMRRRRQDKGLGEPIVISELKQVPPFPALQTEVLPVEDDEVLDWVQQVSTDGYRSAVGSAEQEDEDCSHLHHMIPNFHTTVRGDVGEKKIYAISVTDVWEALAPNKIPSCREAR